MKILEADIRVFDTETTGVDTARDAIVELAAVELRAGQVGRSFAIRLNPGMPIPEGASAVHGITDADVADAPFFDEAADRIAARLGAPGVVLAGYNALHFDVPMVNAAFENAGHAFRIDASRVLDPFVFLRRRHAHLGGKLADVCARHGVTLDNAHAASADARATAELIVAFIRDGLMPTDLEHALEVQARWHAVIRAEKEAWGRKLYRNTLPDGTGHQDLNALRIGFGKQRGALLTEVDSGLLRWAVGLPDFHPGAAAVFRAELERRAPRREVPPETSVDGDEADA